MKPLPAVVVLGISAFMLAVFMPTLTSLSGGVPAGRWPLELSGRRIVSSTAPGVKPGDVVDVEAMSARDRAFLRDALPGSGYVGPGSVLQLPVLRDGKLHVVTIHSVTRRLVETRLAAWVIALRTLSYLVFVFIGTGLLLLRPSALTIAFYCFCIGTLSTAQMEWFYVFVAPQAYWYADIGFNLLFLLGEYLGFVVFCALFPTGVMSRQRRSLMLVLVPLLALGGIWVALTPDDAFFAMPDTPLPFTVFLGVCLALGTAFLLRTYGDAKPVDRQRLRWVIAAIILGLCGSYASNAVLAYVPVITPATLTLLKLVKLLEVVTPIAVAYAVLHHRIIDVNFVISKAVVYTVLSAIVVGLFALVDLFFSRALSASKAGLLADVALALVLGFFFNGLHSRIDQLVDSILFRGRHRAEEHLHMVIDAMPYAENESDLEDMLVTEPVRAFALNGGELKRNTGGHLDGVADSGKLVAYLRGRQGPMRMERGTAALAVPVFSHGDLAAVAFYGMHRNGSDLDSDEIAILSRLAASAGAAFDRLEAAALRAENQALRAVLGGVPIG